MNTFKLCLSICSLFILSCTTQGNIKDNTVDLIIGTYTNEGSSEGIYVYTFNKETGELLYKNKTTDIENPSFLTLSPDRKNIYAVSEFGSDSIGMVYAYDFDAESGALTFKNKVSAGGNGPCYVSVDKMNSYVFTANYGSGSLAAIPILDDGSLSQDIQEIYNKGNLVEGTEGPSRMHSVVTSPDNRYLFAANLGTDKIGVYSFNEKAKTNSLKELEFVSLPEKSGPRHFVFHPNRKYAYLIQELDGGITAFNYDDGKLNEMQNVSIIPEGFQGSFATADIQISPDGLFLYGSNRLELNEIVIYSIDQENGSLTFVNRESSLGKNPRNFAIDPSGNFLLVANQTSDEIVVFKRNKETGLLSATDIRLEIGRPVCLKFVN